MAEYCQPVTIEQCCEGCEPAEPDVWAAAVEAAWTKLADLVLRLVGAAADEPFMPGVILTPWLTNPALIVGFVPVEIVVGPLTRNKVFDTGSNLTDTLDEFRFVFTFTLPGRATNTRTGTTP